MRHNRIDRVVAAGARPLSLCIRRSPAQQAFGPRFNFPPLIKEPLVLREVWPIHLIWNYPNTALSPETFARTLYLSFAKHQFPHGSPPRCALFADKHVGKYRFLLSSLEKLQCVVSLLVSESNAVSVSLSPLSLSLSQPLQWVPHLTTVSVSSERSLTCCRMIGRMLGRHLSRTTVSVANCHRSWK